MNFNFHHALALSSIMILSNCSTPSSEPLQVVTRDVTATCPPARIEVDRRFNKEPPACITGADKADPFQFKTGESFAGSLIESVGGIASPQYCLAETARWINEERQSRGLTDDTTDG